MSITEIKKQVLNAGLSKEQVRLYGDLRYVETWEKALESVAVCLDITAELEECEGKPLDQQPEVAIPSEIGCGEIIPFTHKTRKDFMQDELARQREIFQQPQGLEAIADCPPPPPPPTINRPCPLPERQDIPGIEIVFSPSEESPHPGSDRRVREAVFSSSNHYGEWTSNNCEKCVKNDTCDISDELPIAYLNDGKVSPDIKSRLAISDGYSYMPANQVCGEFQKKGDRIDLAPMEIVMNRHEKNVGRMIAKVYGSDSPAENSNQSLSDILIAQVRSDIERYFEGIKEDAQYCFEVNYLDDQLFHQLNELVDFLLFDVRRSPKIFDIWANIPYFKRKGFYQLIPFAIQDIFHTANPSRDYWECTRETHFLLLYRPAPIPVLSEKYGGVFIPNKLHELGNWHYLWKFPGAVQAENFLHEITDTKDFAVVSANQSITVNTVNELVLVGV